jgi:hypothetical protein
MPEEKIGEDILGGTPPSRMPPKKRRELEQKLKEELAKKKAEEEEEKLSKLPIPDDQHIPKPGEPGWDDLAEDVKKKIMEGKAVHVDEHYRGR